MNKLQQAHREVFATRMKKTEEFSAALADYTALLLVNCGILDWQIEQGITDKELLERFAKLMAE